MQIHVCSTLFVTQVALRRNKSTRSSIEINLPSIGLDRVKQL